MTIMTIINHDYIIHEMNTMHLDVTEIDAGRCHASTGLQVQALLAEIPAAERPRVVQQGGPRHHAHLVTT